MASGAAGQSLLLALPDPCLIAVLQHCAADDQCSLFSAARSHSRLHQAAVQVLHSITADVAGQLQADGVLLYLDRHRAYVDQLTVLAYERTVSFWQLPLNLQLESLQLQNVGFQLQPGRGLTGPASAAALKQLQLENCRVLDIASSQELGAALSLLPAGLEHLGIRSLLFNSSLTPEHDLGISTAMLQDLQQLTYLELAGNKIQKFDHDSAVLQPLQAFASLVDLRLNSQSLHLDAAVDFDLTASMLSGAHRLTRLEVRAATWEADVLSGKTQLQHLHIPFSKLTGGSAPEAQLLSHLQHMQQLIYINLSCGLRLMEGGNPPAAAYSALTASSKLQHLSIRGCTLPAGVWQHMFPVGRQLPHLKFLNISGVRQLPQGSDGASYAPAPEGSRLVSCCPGLTFLVMHDLHHSTGLLKALQGLSALRTLCAGYDVYSIEGCNAVCQLTGLRDLSVICCGAPVVQEALLRLAQQKQQTALRVSSNDQNINLTCEDPDDEPVWRQLLHFCADLSDPVLAQQAAAALAE